VLGLTAGAWEAAGGAAAGDAAAGDAAAGDAAAAGDGDGDGHGDGEGLGAALAKAAAEAAGDAAADAAGDAAADATGDTHDWISDSAGALTLCRLRLSPTGTATMPIAVATRNAIAPHSRRRKSPFN
jgi:hypothetical protein